MYIIYHDVGGAHSTAIAAALHLNQLPLDHIPTRDEILALPLFDRLEKHQISRLIYHGHDEYNHEVYTIGRKYHPRLIMNALQTVLPMTDKDPKQVLCVDTSSAVNNLMRIGGGSSRRFGLVAFGRPIVTYGALKAYPQIVDIVKKTKLKIAP